MKATPSLRRARPPSRWSCATKGPVTSWSSYLRSAGSVTSSRLLRDLVQDRRPARLDPGVRRDAPTLRLPAGVIGMALSWPVVSPGTVRGEARKGFAQLEVAVPSLPDVTE
jgi:hypothetical protein